VNYFLIFLSGAAALVYEVVWSRQLATFLGISSQATTVVLATFMTGLALGSRILGPWADRRRDPLRLFGLFELGIAICGLLGIWLLPLVETTYAFLSAGRPEGSTGTLLTRLLMSGAALLLPTFLMGGTLPALVRGLEKKRASLSHTIASIYGANTLGAAAGAAAAGYLLLPRLGIRGTLLAAVASNLMVAAVFLLPRRQTVPDGPAPSLEPVALRTFDQTPGRGNGRRVLGALGLSGLAAMALQLAWVRALTLVLGSSVYAFSITLATYLVGVALGSLLFARLTARLQGSGRTGAGSAFAWAAGLEAAVGFAAILGLPVIGRLPELFLAAYRAGVQESFAALQGVAALLTASVILAPTLCLGALFPLLTALVASENGPSNLPGKDLGKNTGRDIGTAAAVNSIGTVVGIIAAGLLVLPWLGVQGTVIAAAALHVTVGGWLWLARGHGEARQSHRFQAATAVVALVLLAAVLPRWDPVVMTSGPFVNASRILDVPEGESFRDWIRKRNRVVFYAEGADGNISVRDVGEERLLVINGKADGSRHGDRKTQLVVGHLPLLMHERPEQVLMVGFGTGMSAGAAATHEAIKALEVLEISREVVEASQFFQQENKGVLFDPRLRLLITDARNHLRTTDKLYDVIVSEPSNPWISGISNLFTQEFFTLALRRLAVGGVMSQWFHTYSMSEQDLRSVLATYRSVFPYVTVWAPQLGDLVLIGSRTPHRLKLERLRMLAGTAGGFIDLLPFDLIDPQGWARMYLLGPDELTPFVEGAPLNTDDRPRVEFSAPRNLYSETTLSNMRALVAALNGQPHVVAFAGLGGVDSKTGELEAFGLELSPPAEGWWSEDADGDGQEEPPAVEWLVSWTEAVSVGTGESLPATPSSNFAVGNRRVIRWGPNEIGCGWTQAPLDPTALLEYLDGLLPGTIAATGSASLAGGTRAVWAEADGATRALGLAWYCVISPEGGGGANRCAATLLAPPTGLGAITELASRLRCVSREPAIAP